MKRTSPVQLLALCIAAAMPLACGKPGEAQLTSHSEQWDLDVCSGPNTLPDGGSFNVLHDWNDMGVQDQTGYTGIDSSNPNDQGVIAGEQQAAAAMNGAGCIFGAHGGNPAKCGGQTSVQSLPHDTSQSILYTEYHPECVGKPLILSVCFGGQSGTNGFISIGSVVSQNYGVPANQIVACTGSVVPGNPMQCYGTLVDGNGNPIGNQTVGGLNFVQVRGDPPTDGSARCGSDDPCPCTLDGGTPDSGTPDSGTPDSGTSDGGTPDSGTPDSGTPDSGTSDSGTPDSGTSDGGTSDGGTSDGGTSDGGTSDGGTLFHDAGVMMP